MSRPAAITVAFASMGSDVGEFAGKRVVVTGGSRGIGRSVVELFAAHGARIAAIARNEQALGSLAAEVAATGGEVHPVCADLSVAGGAQLAVRDAIDRLGGVDVLINNGGGWGDLPGATGPLLETTEQGFDFVLDLNVRAMLFASVQAGRAMIDQGAGRGVICSTASIDGLFPAPGEGLYGAAKAAVINLTGTLAYELGPHGIRVNAVAPAIVETDLTAPWLAGADQRLDRVSLYPLARVGQPVDVAYAVLYLCSDAASWVSGVTLPINGGQQATGNAFRWVREHNEVPANRRI